MSEQMVTCRGMSKSVLWSADDADVKTNASAIAVPRAGDACRDRDRDVKSSTWLGVSSLSVLQNDNGQAYRFNVQASPAARP